MKYSNSKNDGEKRLYAPSVANSVFQVPFVKKKNIQYLLKSKQLEKFDIIHLLGSDYSLSKQYNNSVFTVHEFYYTMPHFFNGLTIHGVMADLYHNYSLIKLRTYLHHSKKIIVPSSFVANDLKYKTGFMSEVIHHWVDTNIFKLQNQSLCRERLKLSPNLKYLLNVSHSGFNKNQVTLLKIADLLPDNIKIIHIGNTLLHKNIINVSKMSDELYPLYFCASDQYLHTSTNEGFGIPLLESLASGLPVISNRRSTANEILSEIGFYVKNPYQPKEYIDKILECNSKYDEKYCKNKIYNRSLDFSEERAINNYLRIYKEFAR